MLIVCPNCATSYTVDQAAIGAAGRTVRCARCKTTWFAGGPQADPQVSAFVDGVIAEAEAQSPGVIKPDTMPPPAPEPVYVAPQGDDFSIEAAQPTVPEAPPVVVHVETPQIVVEHVEVTPPVTEPVSIADAPSLVPPAEPPAQAGAPHPDADGEDIESFAARRQRLKQRRQQARRSSRWTALVLVLFAFNVALIGARSEVVRFFPQTASLFASIGLPVNLRSLKFEGVRISKEDEDGNNILVVEGVIVSTASKPVEVPRLRFAARNAGGQEVYSWTAQPTRSVLDPGERLPFSSRLTTPPADASDIMVRFFNTQDAAAAAK
jgi:predicted Zn finger-like uncharacterized protein